MTPDDPTPDAPLADHRQPTARSLTEPPVTTGARATRWRLARRRRPPILPPAAVRVRDSPLEIRACPGRGSVAAPWWLRTRRTHRFGHGEDGHGHEGGDGPGSGPAGDGRDGVLAAVRDRAADVHERLAHDHDVFAVEFVGSTGGGKTTLAEVLLERLDGRVGVVCGDVAGADDARRYREHGVAVENVTTGKECHLDPRTVDEALDAFDLEALDVLLVENVGNMVCPADFPLGASVRVLVVSPTEGDDVVRKHPLLFQAVDAAVVNKVDVADAVGADVDRMVADACEVAPELPVVRTSAETGRGVDDLVRTLQRRREHGHHHD